MAMWVPFLFSALSFVRCYLLSCFLFEVQCCPIIFLVVSELTLFLLHLGWLLSKVLQWDPSIYIWTEIYCCLFKLSVLTEVLFWCFLCLFHLLDFVFHRFCWIPHSSTFLRVIFQYIPLDSIALDRFECLSQKRVFTCYLEAGIQYIALDSIALDRFNWMFISEKSSHRLFGGTIILECDYISIHYIG